MLPNRRRAYHHNGPAGPLENDESDPSAPAPVQARPTLPDGYSPIYSARQDGLEDSNHLGFLVGAGDEPEVTALLEVASENLELKQNLVQKKQMEQQISRQQQEWKSRYWTAQEHQRFLEGLKVHGQRNFKAIAGYVGTRTSTQVKTHAQKFFQKMARQKGNETSSSGGADGSTCAEAVKDSDMKSDVQFDSSEGFPLALALSLNGTGQIIYRITSVVIS
ncbi:hypothetical protein GUITHDRAFT_147214 [Guillardia theta CCMP2712]|uniref:Uncharacterized protein n=1 Tax=Guillardia theta (strain CCMP2712) TaxID=905079 RepID=L1IF06_GUITC|nr:hypothetical protein GUITHDRAFT_147214 [Guillardia theta CCMP2712]EKX34435.1 hypothetical protein GUITHDRAFT_147214 [Guillardia theta CCMP2712]|eukprot:XP_005821415.1 hypothetical protein GUITHDRAFT_147214 [Guillardia theta CCMP2712]